MTSIAKGVPCRFDVYWGAMVPNSRFCRVLNGGHFGREFTNGYFGPVGTADNEEFLRLDSIEGEINSIARLTMHVTLPPEHAARGYPTATVLADMDSPHSLGADQVRQACIETIFLFCRCRGLRRFSARDPAQKNTPSEL